jgi:hypothetical protein
LTLDRANKLLCTRPEAQWPQRRFGLDIFRKG